MATGIYTSFHIIIQHSKKSFWSGIFCENVIVTRVFGLIQFVSILPHSRLEYTCPPQISKSTGRLIKMKIQVPFESINVVPSVTLLVVSSFAVTADTNGTPSKFILSVCIDSEKAGINAVEIPIYVPASPSFESVDHLRMQANFQKGDPFCAVECENLKVFKNTDTNEFFGTANSFTVPDNFEKWEDII